MESYLQAQSSKVSWSMDICSARSVTNNIQLELLYYSFPGLLVILAPTLSLITYYFYGADLKILVHIMIISVCMQFYIFVDLVC